MDLRHLRYFAAVAATEHVGRAAAGLGIAQPPLSRAIRALESELGVALFERGARGVRLSPAGAALLPEARRLLRDAEAFRTGARQFASGEAGTLAIGFVSTAAYNVLPRLLPRFRARRPGVRVVLREATSDVQPPALVAGDLDLAGDAAAEVVATADRFGSVGLAAIGRQCTGAVALARGDAVVALAALRDACARWQDLDAPYEAARSRVLLASAYRLLDDEDAAARECSAARACFEELGAAADLRALAAAPNPPCGLTAREVEVLRLVAAGATNRAIGAQLFISEKTVARHVSNIFTKIGVSTRAAATAYAYSEGLTTPGG